MTVYGESIEWAPLVLLYLFAPTVLLLVVLGYAAGRILQNAPLKPQLRVVARVVRRSEDIFTGATDASAGCAGYIAICNTGKIGVLCTEVGFAAQGPGGERLRLRQPRGMQGEAWPLELKPGQTALVAAAPGDLVDLVWRARWSAAYVRSSMGDVFRATERDMRDFRRDVIEEWGTSAGRGREGPEGMGEVSPA